MSADPCPACEPIVFDLDMEWASNFARLTVEADEMRQALHEVCRDIFARFDFDAYALPAVRKALGKDHVRECRRVLREARATREVEGWYGMDTEGAS